MGLPELQHTFLASYAGLKGTSEGENVRPPSSFTFDTFKDPKIVIGSHSARSGCLHAGRSKVSNECVSRHSLPYSQRVQRPQFWRGRSKDTGRLTCAECVWRCFNLTVKLEYQRLGRGRKHCCTLLLSEVFSFSGTAATPSIFR